MLLVGRNAAAFAIILPPAQAAMRRDSDRNAAGLNQKPGLKSWPISAVAAAQAGQRMCVSSSFSEWKRFKERSVHSHFSSAFHDRGAPRRGRTPQLNCIKPSQEYSKKRDSRMCFLLTQDALCDSRGTHSAIFFLS